MDGAVVHHNHGVIEEGVFSILPQNSQNGRGGNGYMCVRVFVAQKTLTLAKKTHLHK